MHVRRFTGYVQDMVQSQRCSPFEVRPDPGGPFVSQRIDQNDETYSLVYLSKYRAIFDRPISPASWHTSEPSADLLVKHLIPIIDVRHRLILILSLLPLPFTHTIQISLDVTLFEGNDPLLVDLPDNSIHSILTRFRIPITERIGSPIQIFRSSKTLCTGRAGYRQLSRCGSCWDECTRCQT